MKPLILHISNDYPDPLQPDKTRAILHLVEGTPEFRHVVYSLNRVNGLGGIASIPFGEDRTAVAYGALPKGIFWEKRLDEVAQWILADLKSKNIVPDLIEAHKLTVEGIIAETLVAAFGCRLVCDIQGGTDLTVLKVKVGLRKRYQRIANLASLILPYAPWVIGSFNQLITMDRSKCDCLPVLPGFDTLTPSAPSKTPRLITLMRFGDRKNKNLAGIVAAMASLSARYPTLTLDVYGGGAPLGLLRLMKMVRESGLEDRVRFQGPVANARLPQLLGEYSALVMPSFSETYGLVYAEALFCGVPVMFSKGRAIDGYFDTQAIGYACDPGSIDDIANGISHLLENEGMLKQNIARMQSEGAFESIRKAAILSKYREGLNRVLAMR